MAKIRDYDFGRSDSAEERRSYTEEQYKEIIIPDSKALEMLSFDGSCYLIYGNKGSGKTNLCTQLFIEAEMNNTHIYEISIKPSEFRAYKNLNEKNGASRLDEDELWLFIIYLKFFIHIYLKCEKLKDNKKIRSDVNFVVRYFKENKIESQIFEKKQIVLKNFIENIIGDLKVSILDKVQLTISNLSYSHSQKKDCRSVLNSILNILADLDIGKFIIVLDELDELFMEEEGSSISFIKALSINDKNKKKYKIIAAIRENFVKGNNINNYNKIQQDHLIRLTWSEPKLRNMLNNRFQKLNNKDLDFKKNWKEIFPPAMKIVKEIIDEKGNKKFVNCQISSWEYCLSYTRYLPRDIIVLLRTLTLKFGTQNKLNPGDLKRLVHEYSINYFFSETCEELMIMYKDLNQDELNEFFQTFECFDFDYNIFLHNLKNCISNKKILNNPLQFFKYLLDQGYIGHKVKTINAKQKDSINYEFVFNCKKNNMPLPLKNKKVDNTKKYILHKALQRLSGEEIVSQVIMNAKYANRERQV